MVDSKFSLTWDAYKKNLCNGLSSLQQNEEFVDMTLAADGHFVKVHQVILALASPYIKELISSINCTHPVLFLNKISYTTLCLVLEYIYTGEVLVSIENISDLLEAGRELHIKGLEDMKLHESLNAYQELSKSTPTVEQSIEDEISYVEITSHHEHIDDNHSTSINDKSYREIEYLQEREDDSMEGLEVNNHSDFVITKEVDSIYSKRITQQILPDSDANNVSLMQYTVSNQGSLQMILNRFVYYLKYTNRDNSRQWRCVDYLTGIKCPAYVVTNNEVVTQRISAHTHPFHDNKILQKVRRGAIFAAIQDAEREGHNVTNKRAENKVIVDDGEE